MKIRTEIRISNQSKAAMVANGIPIPESNMTFEMSTAKAHIFASPHARFNELLVTPEEIYTTEFYINNIETKYIAGGIDSKDGYITAYTTWVGTVIRLQDTLVEAIISGELKEGDSIDTYLEKVEEQMTENQRLYDQMQAQIAEFPAHAPQREAARKTYEAEQEKLRREKEAEDAKELARKADESRKVMEEKERRRQERLTWAREHGSERLRKGLEQEHTCIKLYEIELGEHLIADRDYEYDRENMVDEKNRSCPSLKALEEVERLNQIKGLSAQVVWLPEGLRELHKNTDECFEPGVGCEAVKVDVAGTSGYWYKKY